MIPISYGIGVGLYTTEVNFEPNLNANYEGLVTNNVGEDIRVMMKVKGELAEYVTFGQEYMEIPEGQVSIFTFNIKLPETIKPGINVINIGAEDVTDSKGGGMINSKTAAFFPFKIRVPYPGKYIESSFSVPNIEENQTAVFNIDIVSRGKETIRNIDGIIEIFDGEDKIDVLSVGPLSDVVPGESETMKAEWDSTGHAIGNYRAKAKIDYDDEELEMITSFNIGSLLLEIIDYTREVYKNEINQFDIDIQSYWNDAIEGVYGQITVDDQKIETLKIRVEGWGKPKLIAYLDTTNLELGEQDADMKVYYGDKISREMGKVTVLPEREKIIEKPSNISPITVLLVAIIMLLIVGNSLLVIYFVRQRRTSKRKKK